MTARPVPVQPQPPDLATARVATSGSDTRGRRRITGAVGRGNGLTMVSKRLYVDHLSKVDLFSEFSRKDLEKVASAGTHVSFPADTTLIRQDESGLEAFVVLSGEVNVKRNGRSVLTAGRARCWANSRCSITSLARRVRELDSKSYG